MPRVLPKPRSSVRTPAGSRGRMRERNRADVAGRRQYHRVDVRKRQAVARKPPWRQEADHAVDLCKPLEVGAEVVEEDRRQRMPGDLRERRISG